MAIDAQFDCSNELLAIAPGYVRMTADQAAERFRPREAPPRVGFDGQVALVQLVGELSKRTTVEARLQINALAQNPHVSEILLLLDSPGDNASGVHDLHLAVARAVQNKPVIAFAEDMCCSGAYWVASAASKIYLNETGLAGSIGVFHIVVDYSRALEREGVDYFIVRSGPQKGVGVYGDKISEAAIASIQARVDALYEHFVTTVAKGRGMRIDSVREVADGRVLMGKHAKAAGLVDEIAVFEDVLQEALSRHPDRYVRLVGFEAAEKLEQLARDAGPLGELVTRNSFPELAAAADSYRNVKAQEAEDDRRRRSRNCY